MNNLKDMNIMQFSTQAGNNPQQYQPYQPQQQFGGNQYATPLPQPQFNPAAAKETAYQTAGSPYAQTLQQLQALQQQQQQQQQQPQSQAPAQPAQQQYAEQLRAYYAQQQQQQQQQLFAQKQQELLLKQLYTSHPSTATTNAAELQPQPEQSNQYFTAEEYANYLTDQQQQQQSLISQPQQQYFTSPTQATHASTYSMPSTSAFSTASATAPRNGLQYSSADQVSHTKFQSGNLAYNF